ncbi:MAG TPA: O-antigen ligase family protein [Gemmatimonas sp.]|nr:O-antigen ligase family protein [Gemmatimonas sp.]
MSPDLLRTVLFLFIIVSISTVQGYIRIIGLLRPGLTLWALAFGTVLLMPRTVRWGNISASWPPKAIAAIAGIAILGAPFGLSLGASGAFVLDAYIRVLILFFILVVAIRTIDDLYLLVWAFVLATATLALLALTVMKVSSGFGGTRVEASSLYDANDLGMIFMSTVPLCILLIETSGRKGRVIATLSIGLIGAATAVTGSRGAFIGMMLVLPALFLTMGHVSAAKRGGLIVFLLLGLVVGAPDGYWDRIATIFEIGQDYNVTDPYGRVEVAKRGVGYMLGRPLFGVGVDNFPRAEFTISPLAQNALAGGLVRAIAPHNTYVQVGAEMGLVALALWLSIILKAIVGLRSNARAIRRRIRIEGPTFEAHFLSKCFVYFPVTFLAFAVTSYFVSHAYSPPFYILSALLSGVLLLHARGMRRFRSRAKVSLQGSGLDAPLARIA